MNVLDELLKLINSSEITLDKVDEAKGMLLNEIGQCEDILQDPELMEHEKAPYRRKLVNYKIAMNKL